MTVVLSEERCTFRILTRRHPQPSRTQSQTFSTSKHTGAFNDMHYLPNAGAVDEAPKAEEDAEAPNAGVAVAPKPPVAVPLPNSEVPGCAPLAGVVLPNGFAPNGLFAWVLVPNGFGLEPNGLVAAGAPNGLGLVAPKAEHTQTFKRTCQKP
jgi:hypothetical protein